MLFSPRFSPLLATAICGVILLGLGAMFVSQLHQLSTRLNDAAAVRSELHRIVQAALPTRDRDVEAPAVDAASDQKANVVVAEIGTRMRELGAPLWEDQATVLKRALVSGEHGVADPIVIPDEVIGEAASALSPRQVQILALVQAEIRWTEAMRGEGSSRPDGDVSLR